MVLHYPSLLLTLPESFQEAHSLEASQSFARFLYLPREIRDQIYAFHFSSITLTYPAFTLPPLLFTSRQIHSEALPLLRPNATYDLLTTEHFLDYLTTLSPATLAQLRHISLRDVPFPVYVDGDSSGYTTHSFSDLLPLFPGLKLDTLIVEDAFHGENVDEDGWWHDATYDIWEYMIEGSTGWKELVLRSESDCWLEDVVFETHASDGTVTTKTNGRSKQPAAWDRMIKERDGPESAAQVEMWCSKTDGVWEKVQGDYNANETKLNDSYESTGADSPMWVRGEDRLARPSIEVRVRRGKGVEYAQDGVIAYEGTYILKLYEMFLKLGWKEIKARDLFIPGAEYDPCPHL